MKRILFFISISSFLAACNAGPNRTNIEIIHDMMDQKSIKSQDWNPEQGDKVQMLMPPDHTVSRGHPPYAYAGDPAGAEKQKNPFAGNRTPEFLAKGQKYYTIYCLPCHGEKGAGDGQIAEKMPVKPRDLINAEAKAYTDGRIYDAITAGKGVMGSYLTQITEANDRWAVVNYVRTLQR